MTQQDKREMFRHNLRTAVLNAHKHGMSWKHLHELLSDEVRTVWAKHQKMLTLFPENARHSK
jgi:hypothetical protein